MQIFGCHKLFKFPRVSAFLSFTAQLTAVIAFIGFAFVFLYNKWPDEIPYGYTVRGDK